MSPRHIPTLQVDASGERRVMAVLSPVARSTRSTILASVLVGKRRVRNKERRGRIAFRRLFDSNGFWLHSRVSASRRRRLLSAAAAHLSVQQNATLRHQTCNIRSGANSHIQSLYLLPHDAVKCAARPPGHAVRWLDARERERAVTFAHSNIVCACPWVN